MSPELDRRLCERYPLVFRHRHQDPPTSPMSWGFECGDGWYALIDAACAVVSRPWASEEFSYQKLIEAGEPPEVVENARAAMKAREHDVPVARQVKEKFGTLRIHLDGGGERARAACEFASIMSESTCELCGRPGKLADAGGWMRVRCSDHEHE